MVKTPKISSWFLACVATFFTRAFLYSTWVSRGPEVKAALHLDNAQMGLFVMLYPLGGLLGVLFASQLRDRFGSSALTYVGFTVSTAAFAALAFTVPAGNLAASSVLLFLMGIPMSIADFITNYQATAVNSRSSRTLMPAIHSAFGFGMMLGAGAANLFIAAKIDLTTEYLVTAVIVLLPALYAAYIYPPESVTGPVAAPSSEVSTRAKSKSPWTEARTLKIATIGFMFIMAEMTAATWVPIALVDSGSSGADAAAALGAFWIVVTAIRAVGGFVVDKLGRQRTILFSALAVAAGIGLFALTPVFNLSYLGLVLWAAGMAMGFPLSVSSMGDDPARSSARINMIISVVYISSVTAGPALGFLGQYLGTYASFAIPIALAILSAVLSPATKLQRTQ
jgi:MFS family permease